MEFTTTPEAKMSCTSAYFNEVVNYGGLPTTRADMIRDLDAIAATHTDDPSERLRIRDSYLMGHAQSDNPFAGFATVEAANAAIFAQFVAMAA